METKNKNIISFFISLLAFKLVAFAALLVFYPEFSSMQNGRLPASDPADCVTAVNEIVNKEVDDTAVPVKEVSIDESAVQNASKKFWENKNGTFIGASYYKAKKAIFSKMKLSFMDINSNFRPIYYIEDDEASYPKIFDFIESKVSKGADEAPSKVETEVLGWLETFKSYNKDMENLVSEYATLAQYVKKVRELKGEKNLDYPFEIEVKLLKDGSEQRLKDYVAGPEELNNILFKLKGKMKKLKGTSYFRFGAIDTRDFNQALLATRLKSLESEIRNHIASTPKDEEHLKGFLKELIAINRNPENFPTLKFVAKLEFEEMNAEYKDLFKSAEIDYKKIDESAKKVIENLSPRYQEKLGLNAVKNWVTVMKAGRAGIFIGGIGTLGTGIGALAIRGWTWLNYDEDSTYDIINAEDEAEFNEKLKKYLKGKYNSDLIRRIVKKDENSMTLDQYDPKNKKDVEIVEYINGIIKERKAYHREEKQLKELEDKLATAIESVGDTSSEGDNKTNRKKVTKKPSQRKPNE